MAAHWKRLDTMATQATTPCAQRSSRRLARARKAVTSAAIFRTVPMDGLRMPLIQARRPRWEALNQLLDNTRGLPVFAELHPQVMAIAEQRALLAEPDHIPGLCEQLTQALRQALVADCTAYKTDDDAYRNEL